MLARREFLIGLAGLGLSSCMSTSSHPEGLRPSPKPTIPRTPGATTVGKNSLPSLRELGRVRGIEIGAAFNGNKNRKYRRLLTEQVGLIAPEWQLKPRFLKPGSKARYNFGPSDQIAKFAAANGMAFHGHTLFWHEEPIRWAESSDFEHVKRDYGGFIKDVVSHYPQAVSWDVFNEIVEENTPFRNEYLIQKHGLKFIDYCLRTVHELAPNARLALNEYNLECGESWCGDKRENMLRLLGNLRRMGTPLHAIGIQSHLSTVYRASPAETVRFIDRLSDLGLEVYLSELDVNDSTLPQNIAERDKQVADYMEGYLDAALSRSAVKRLLFWGISDFDNWVVRRYTSEKRKLGTGDARPALFDFRNEPKPAFFAVVRALQSAPARVS